jgi:mannose-6-phosphate isomerase-like protein (cupin superfamily)
VLTIDLNDLELAEGGTAGGSIRVAFPLHSGMGTSSTAAVLFELEPGSALATHTDSAEEVLLILAGEGEAHVGHERGLVRAGQLTVVPAMAPHGIRNVGETTLRVLGFFSSSTVVSTFDAPAGPEGEDVFVTGARVPILARSDEPAPAAV